MNLNELLAELSDRSVQVWLDGNKLGIRAPKGVLTPELRQNLAQQKEALINLLRQRDRNLSVSEKPLGTIPRPDVLPLTFEQERLFNISRLVPQNAAHNLTHLIKLTGQLDVNVLQKSLEAITQRHEALRTIFVLRDDKPFQKVLAVDSIELSQLDWRNLTPEQQKSAVEKLAEQESQYPFEIIGERLWRCQLANLSQTDYILSLTFHHLITDLLSVALFIEELVAHYQAIFNHTNPDVPELPIQYGDFALWQQQLLKEEFLHSQIENWKSELTGNPPLVELPSDHPRALIRSFQGSHEPFILKKELWDGLKHLSQQAGCTPFVTLLAAFKVLLHRYSGQTDIRIGSPTSGRIQRQLEPLIGFLAYPLVLRTDLSGNPSFKNILGRVKEVIVKAQSQQKIPFGKILEFMPPELRGQQNPFTVLFSFVNKQVESSVVGNLTITPITEMTQGMRDLDLLVSIYGAEGGLSGGFEYNTDLFEASTIRRMIGHFQTLLGSIIANPDQRIGELPLLTPTEHQLIHIEWHRHQKAYPQDRCLHQLFEEQVAKTPEAIAVVFEDQTITYRQLNQKANQLAHYLQKQGIKPDHLVGICIERSPEMIVGILGILKAGGAYVPLDPTYPQQRLTDILIDSQVDCLLTQAHLLSQLPQQPTQVICLDRDWPIMAEQPCDNPMSGTQSQNLAYVIYTSGSTGKPKGVLIEHYNVTRLFAATECWYHFNQEDVWTVFHSYAFDFSVWEIWGALLYGGRLVIVDYWTSRSPEAFYELLCREKVTVLNQTPSAFRQLIHLEETRGKSGDLSLRFVIFGGEALEIQSLKPWWERHGDRFPQLVNMYGITETTVHVTYRPLTKADLEAKGSMIGCPIGDLETYILDAYLQPVPIGIVGELYIGGAGLARGYLNRPELTQTRFINNPFQPQIGKRLYKTGDLARYLENGDIEYLGRIDHQVKIRGFRIELGEIEAMINQYDPVRASVVIDREDQPGNKRLVAYVVPKSPHFVITDLRHFLQKTLPDYMVPSTFVLLESIPLTGNGKVDRQSLPAPNPTQRESEVPFVAPRTPTEKVIATISAEILGLEQISINDNFFELGGNSLMATQILSRLRETFAVELPLYRLFELPTIIGLAQEIDKLKEQKTRSQPPTIVRVSREARRMKRP